MRFLSDGERIIDSETRSVWNLSGIAISGPLAGQRLKPLESQDSFAFAWFAFHPESDIYQ